LFGLTGTPPTSDGDATGGTAMLLAPGVGVTDGETVGADGVDSVGNCDGVDSAVDGELSDVDVDGARLDGRVLQVGKRHFRRVRIA
jgi:hypothetical protein